MKIFPQSGTLPIHSTTQNSRSAPRPSETAPAPKPVKISNAAHYLADNQSRLQKQLSVREEIIQRFSGNMSDPVNLHERTIDLIIQRIKNT